MEEKVTKAILKWLEERSWKIVCFDFPQSGTGRILHPNDRTGVRNRGAVIPDIVAVREKIVVFFENKDKFDLSDFEKIEHIRTNNNYSEALQALLSKHDYQRIFYGVGLPITNINTCKVEGNYNKVDFVIDSNGVKVAVNFQRETVF